MGCCALPFDGSQRFGLGAFKSCDDDGNDINDPRVLYSSSGCGGGVLHSDHGAKSPKYGDELSEAGCFFVTTMSFILKLIFGLFFGGS